MSVRESTPSSDSSENGAVSSLRSVPNISSSASSSSSSSSLSIIALQSCLRINPEQPHPRINGCLPSYACRPYTLGFTRLHKGKSPNREFIQDAQNWMVNILEPGSLTRVERKLLDMNPLLLQYGYLITSPANAAVMKAWSNVAPNWFEWVLQFLHHCLEFNLGFQLAVLKSDLDVFRHMDDPSLPAISLATKIPFTLGFQEPPLSNMFGIETMNLHYMWKATGVARRLNFGAAVAKGGSIGWLARKLAGDEGIKKLLEGPSFIVANLNHAQIISLEGTSPIELAAEPFTLEEEKTLLSFIPASIRKDARTLFPFMSIIPALVKGAALTWNSNAEAFMQKHWDLVLEGEANALSHEEWGPYIASFMMDRISDDSHSCTPDNILYSMDLFRMAYPTDWTIVKLSDMVFLEDFLGYDVEETN
ncbi:uncharacterized protein ARMOST_20080 [Armillaria ostoyae]|uniref:Uncharacterized protein n=1 Tax=Armillaria ostoyae TaxID=47428 RepID=A0A284S6C0_ARMOS|nr:uncharacterized protein ARMOST_20080 [Armillaria ostoyae]